jgi:serine/threonine protein kinase/formylglycine-generating enzyme required for sulfatase activity
MQSEKQAIEWILSAAVEMKSEAERRKFVEDACAGDVQLKERLDELIENHFHAGTFLDAPPALLQVHEGIPGTVNILKSEAPGTVIGRYMLLEQIGEGGFGVVFMAEQQVPIRRQVAVKVLKPGMDTQQVIARFEAERQALALMDHPNIAKVLDAGQTSSGRPYFVMDLVKGLPITEFCDESQFTARERLDLFVHVCQAVQHAHQKGIIHRDIKPTNVLVAIQDAVPVVKVIDFGIAKALGGQRLTDKTLFTGLAQMIGSPLYMSPEQAALGNADVDTRSDIYSLGVLLYELLTGTTPFDKERFKVTSYDEIRRIIREEEPPKPSTRISMLGQAVASISAQRKSDSQQLSRLFRGELDWIVIKALEKGRDRRYETASALAADVDRYLHDEPVQACPPSAWYRFRKFARRNRAVVWAGSVVVLGLAGMIAGALVHNRQLEETRAASRAATLVQGLGSADIAAVPRIIEDLSEYRRWADPLLAQLTEESRAGSKEQLHARLALVATDTRQVEPLSRTLLNASPQELLIIRAALLPNCELIQDGLWQIARDVEAKPDRRLRAACALASFDPHSGHWSSTAPQVAALLVAENPIHLREWLEGFAPIRMALLQPLGHLSHSAVNPVERSMAVSILSEYAADQPELLAELVKDADSNQYAKLFPVLQAHRERAIFLMQQELQKEMPAAEQVTERDVLAKRQAQAAVALLQLGLDEPAWRLLRHEPDPSRRTYLFHDLARLGTLADTILRRLNVEPEVSIRRALILSLGEFTGAQLHASQRQPVIHRLLQWYRDDPDPGIHSAVDWLLRHSQQGSAARKIDWQGKDALEQIDRERAGQPPAARHWYVTREGHTLAVVRDPPVFEMGSPLYEADREAESELPHAMKIPRSFAIATKEVTVAQFRRFLEANPDVKRRHSYLKKYTPDDDGPIISVTWFEAAQYCNWLSKQEEIPEAQWCYPSIESIKVGMDLPNDYLHRTGYRLPTEAEWEYSCRAGASTSRFYGSSEEMLKEYAWYTKTTNDKRAWPVGQLKPNDLGLFDIYGNVGEWCQSRHLTYGPGKNGPASHDTEQSNLKVTDDPRDLRGCGFGYISSLARSASRDWFRPTSRQPQVGVRVARTLP